MADIQRWGSYDIEAANEEQEFLDRIVGDYIKLKEGANIVRILPPPIGRRTPWVMVQEHYVEIDEDKKYRFACPKQMAEQPCPVCAVYQQMKENGNRADHEASKSMFPRFRAYANALDMRAPDLGPRILTAGKELYKQFKELLVQVGDYTNPETGYNTNIVRKGSGMMDTKYQVIPLGPSKIADFDWIDMQHNLMQFAYVPTQDELMQALQGTQFYNIGTSKKGSRYMTQGRVAYAQPQRQLAASPPQQRRRSIAADVAEEAGEEGDFPPDWEK